MKNVIILIIACLLLINGCVQETQNVQEESKTQVKVGFQALTLGHAPAQMIAQQKTLDTLSLEPKPRINDLPGGTTIINALSSSNINMVYGGWGFIIPVIKGLPAKIVAGIANGGNSLVCNTENIKSVKDLKGKTIGVHGQMSTQATVLRLALTEADLDPNEDVNIVIVDRPLQIIALTEKKSIDCIVVGEPVVSKAVDAGAYISVSHEKLYKNNQFPETWVFARTDLIEDNPEGIKSVLSQHVNAISTLRGDRQNAGEILANYYNSQGLETTSEDIEKYTGTYNYNYKINKATIENTINFLHEQGLIESTIPIDDLVDCSFGNCED
ncbi:MAG: ABC transporter substrate-binding protein [Nanoarchaeota archaeon]|nr:ABC transporter substrate-binding protein [Nanoarchaeota archaeon]